MTWNRDFGQESHASDKDDPTVDPRWGRVGKQTIADGGPLPQLVIV